MYWFITMQLDFQGLSSSVEHLNRWNESSKVYTIQIIIWEAPKTMIRHSYHLDTRIQFLNLRLDPLTLLNQSSHYIYLLGSKAVNYG